VLVVLVFFEAVVFCLRWSTTAGPFAAGLAGAGISVCAEVVPAGVVAVGAGVVVGVLEGAGVLVVVVGVVVVSVFVGSVFVGSSAGVVVVTVPSPPPVVPSTASAPPEIGPRLAAVMPLPASAEASARHSHRLEAGRGVMRRSWSSFGRPMVVVRRS
jgi:hypothetical protein